MTEQQRADLNKLLLKETHELWNKEISKILCYAFEECIIDSATLHKLTALFDPTQDHRVGKL